MSIRVGSPGNDAPVTQGNTSTAVAAPVDPALIDAAVTDLPANGPNSYGDLENASSVIQDLAQCSADETGCISSSSNSPQGITGPGGSVRTTRSRRRPRTRPATSTFRSASRALARTV